MYTVSVTVTGGGGLHVHPHIVIGTATDGVALRPSGTEESTTEELDEGPSPIAPEPKELLWGLGSFLVFLVLMRLFLFPKVRQGMTARYGKIRDGHERAEALRSDAQREVADYEQALAGVHAEAATRIDAARHQLDDERTDRLAAVNAAIAERRAAAAADDEAAMAAARDTVETAVADVATRAVELSTGRKPDAATVRRVLNDVLGAGVGS